jgi:hypothetical protein
MIVSRKAISYTFIPLIFGAILIVSSYFGSCKKFPEGFLHVSTDTVEALSGGSFKLIGTVRNIGEEEITQHGFCWGVTTDPTTSGETTQLGATNARGSFTRIISNLNADKK